VHAGAAVDLRRVLACEEADSHLRGHPRADVR
jgi:hypothetical protein